jgi:DNA-binding NarL/FixJ family response regulator
MSLSVYICDNYGALRDLMRFALEDDPRVQVVGEAEDAITCVRELPEARPDVLVLDLRMPGVTGLEAVPEIRDASPDTRIVVYSQYIDDRTEAELREAGHVPAGESDELHRRGRLDGRRPEGLLE